MKTLICTIWLMLLVVVYQAQCPDLNNDNKVNFADFQIYAESWGKDTYDYETLLQIAHQWLTEIDCNYSPPDMNDINNWDILVNLNMIDSNLPDVDVLLTYETLRTLVDTGMDSNFPIPSSPDPGCCCWEEGDTPTIIAVGVIGKWHRCEGVPDDVPGLGYLLCMVRDKYNPCVFHFSNNPKKLGQHAYYDIYSPWCVISYQAAVETPYPCGEQQICYSRSWLQVWASYPNDPPCAPELFNQTQCVEHWTATGGGFTMTWRIK